DRAAARDRVRPRRRPGRSARSDDVVLHLGHPRPRSARHRRARGVRRLPLPLGDGRRSGTGSRRLRGAPSPARGGRDPMRRLGGADHVAFLLALLLLGGGLADVARLVTGFTVGHSLTLGIAVLGYVQPDRAAVEALIGLSIALVAAENVWLGGERTFVLPWTVATTLGLLAVSAAAG